MKTVFVGAVEGSLGALTAICEAGHAPALVITLPAELSHRHSDFADLTPIAERFGVPVHYTRKSDSAETIAAIAAIEPDLTLVIGWSQLCGEDFRAVPRLGCIGFHPTKLPKLRGRAVVPWTILLGERDVGASLFWLGEGADTGPIAAQATYRIDPDTITVRELYDRNQQALCEMLPALLAQIAGGDVPRVEQDHSKATVCALRRPEDGLIDWSRPAEEIHRLIRAVGPPYPGAFTTSAGGDELVLTGVRHNDRDGYYIGMPGQVQAVDGNTFTVYCGDGRCLDITEWHGADAPPRLHTCLGRVAYE